MAIPQNLILAKCQSPKSLLLLHFSMNLSETFRIDVNMVFANTNLGGFLIEGPQISFEPKMNLNCFLWVLEAKVVNLGSIYFQLGFPLNINGNDLGQINLKSIYQKMWQKWLFFGPKSARMHFLPQI